MNPLLYPENPLRDVLQVSPRTNLATLEAVARARELRLSADPRPTRRAGDYQNAVTMLQDPARQLLFVLLCEGAP